MKNQSITLRKLDIIYVFGFIRGLDICLQPTSMSVVERLKSRVHGDILAQVFRGIVSF